MRYTSFAVFLGFILFFTCTGIAADFPYRDKYPEVKIVNLEELKAGYDKGDFLIIDVRSKAEFDAIHIKRAVNLPYAEVKFTSQLRTLSTRNATKKIAVYDNGNKCIKCYKAGEDALYEMIPNVHAFDAGIHTWAKTFPAETIFRGKELTSASTNLFNPLQLNTRKIDFNSFKEKSTYANSVVIDARDPIQRVHELPDIKEPLHIPVDKLVQNIINKGHMKNKVLLIFDQVGGQVEWLMYYLTENNYTDFYFLEGGATSILKEQEYRSLVSVN